MKDVLDNLLKTLSDVDNELGTAYADQLLAVHGYDDGEGEPLRRAETLLSIGKDSGREEHEGDRRLHGRTDFQEVDYEYLEWPPLGRRLVNLLRAQIQKDCETTWEIVSKHEERLKLLDVLYQAGFVVESYDKVSQLISSGMLDVDLLAFRARVVTKPHGCWPLHRGSVGNIDFYCYGKERFGEIESAAARSSEPLQVAEFADFLAVSEPEDGLYGESLQQGFDSTKFLSSDRVRATAFCDIEAALKLRPQAANIFSTLIESAMIIGAIDLMCELFERIINVDSFEATELLELVSYLPFDTDRCRELSVKVLTLAFECDKCVETEKVSSHYINNIMVPSIALARRAFLLRKSGRFDDCICDLRRLVEHARKDLSLAADVAQFLFAKKLFNEDIADFDAVQNLYDAFMELPEFDCKWRASEEFGELCVRTGRDKEAVTAFSAAIVHAPDVGRLYLERARCSARTENIAAAANDYAMCFSIYTRYMQEEGPWLTWSVWREAADYMRQHGFFEQLRTGCESAFAEFKRLNPRIEWPLTESCTKEHLETIQRLALYDLRSLELPFTGKAVESTIERYRARIPIVDFMLLIPLLRCIRGEDEQAAEDVLNYARTLLDGNTAFDGVDYISGTPQIWFKAIFLNAAPDVFWKTLRSVRRICAEVNRCTVSYITTENRAISPNQFAVMLDRAVEHLTGTEAKSIDQMLAGKGESGLEKDITAGLNAILFHHPSNSSCFEAISSTGSEIHLNHGLNLSLWRCFEEIGQFKSEKEFGIIGYHLTNALYEEMADEKADIAELRSPAKRMSPHEIVHGQSVVELLEQEEGVCLEFKSSMLWDIEQKKRSPSITKAIAKALAGLLNGKGGTLLIGVSDTGAVLGLDSDIQALSFKPNVDGLQMFLCGIIQKHLGLPSTHYIDIEVPNLNGDVICRVDVTPSSNLIPLSWEGKKELFVRQGNTTQPLDIAEVYEYTRNRLRP